MKGSSITDRMRAAAWVFARGGSWAEAAAKAGVSKQTLSRYRSRPEWAGILAEETSRGAVVELVPAPTAERVEALPTNWRNLAGLELATAAQPAARLMREAMAGHDVTKAQLDCARWILERMAVGAPEEAAAEEITDADEMAAQIAAAVPIAVLRKAVKAAEG